MQKVAALLIGFICAALLPLLWYFFSSSQLSSINNLKQLQLSAVDLNLRIQQLQDIEELKKLQNVYGYYFDQYQWHELAGLFTAQGTFEQAQEGVYVSQQHIFENLSAYGKVEGGKLFNHFQMQPIVHLNETNDQASMRVREFIQEGQYTGDSFWNEGLYENSYIKEDGVWKIDKLHFYLTFRAPYLNGWEDNSVPIELWREESKPQADTPPSELYQSYPSIFIPPFHYDNPVTGRPSLGLEALQ